MKKNISVLQRLATVLGAVAIIAMVSIQEANAGIISSPLELTINLATQEFDWVDGTSITQLGVGDNRFGTISVVDAIIISPLALFNDPPAHGQTYFYISADGLVVEGIGLFTNYAPGAGSTFSGTSDAPAAATFSLGDFSAFANLTPGSAVLAPVGSWDDGIRVTVLVPEPASVALLGLGLVSVGFRRRNRA